MHRIRVFSCFPMYSRVRLAGWEGVNASDSRVFSLSDVFAGETSGPGASKCIGTRGFLAFRCISGREEGCWMG